MVKRGDTVRNKTTMNEYKVSTVNSDGSFTLVGYQGFGPYTLSAYEVIGSGIKEATNDLKNAIERLRGLGLGVECTIREEIVVKEVKETRL